MEIKILNFENNFQTNGHYKRLKIMVLLLNDVFYE